MATLFTTLMTSLGVSTGAAAGAAASGAGSAISFASLALTAVSGLAGIYAGAQQKAALDQEAVDEEMRATQDEINGREAALKSLRALNADTARIAVAGYASGIGSEGSVGAAQKEAQKVAEQNMTLDRENAKFQSAMRRGQARQLRKEGRAAMAGGIFGAIKGGLSLFDRRTARG